MYEAAANFKDIARAPVTNWEPRGDARRLLRREVRDESSARDSVSCHSLAKLRGYVTQQRYKCVYCVWNVMAHAQKPDFVFRRNGRVHLNRRGRQFSRLVAAEVCASSVVMLDTPCSEVVWEYWLPTPPVSPSLPLPCVTVCHHISTGLYPPTNTCSASCSPTPLSHSLCLMKQSRRKRKRTVVKKHINRHVHEAWYCIYTYFIRSTPSSYFTAVCPMPFGFNAPCLSTPLNLRPFIFGLTPFGCLRSIRVTPYFWLEYYT